MSEFSDFFHGKRVFVTGCSGFIGTHLVNALASCKAEITNVDINPPNIPEHRKFWVEHDYQDSDFIKSLFAERRPEVVYNLAAKADLNVGFSAMTSNIEGLKVLIESCRSLPEKPQLIHFSTQLVAEAGYQPAHDEDFKPYTAYGESKAETERTLRRLGSDLRWTIVRPAAIWGPYNHIFASGIWKYVAKRYYMIPTGNRSVRTYGYVTNLVEQILRIPMTAPGLVDGQVFNIADEIMPGSVWLDAFSVQLTGLPVRRVPYPLLWMLAVAGSASKKLGGPAPLDLGRFERITTEYPVPLDKTVSVLGKGSTSFEKGVEDCVKWLRSCGGAFQKQKSQVS